MTETSSTLRAMGAAPRWLLWRSVAQGGAKKPKKVPLYASGAPRGITDTPEDAAALVTLETAQQVLHASKGYYAGLGFALGPDGTGNYWQGIDFDGLSAHPHLTQLADEITVGYRETSPSGDGLHWIGYGPTPFENMPNVQGVEAYSHGRFFTVTQCDPIDSPLVDLAPMVESKLRPLRGRPKQSQPDEQKQSQQATPFMPAIRETVTVEELKGLLARIPVSDLGYTDSGFGWLNVLMGAHHQFHDADQDTQLAVCTALDEWSKGTEAEPDPRWQAGEVLKKWASFGKNPRMTSPGAAVTIKTLRAMANEFSPVKLPDGERLPDARQGASGGGGAFGAMQVAQFIEGNDDRPWIIKGILPGQGLCQLFGPPAGGKTFAVIDILCHVAMGAPWQGHRVRQGNVIYVAAEGAAGARKRFKAFATHHGVELDTLPLVVLTVAPDILNDKSETGFLALYNTLKQAGRCDLVVIDTLAQTMPGGNENSSEGMGMAIARYTQLVRALDTTLLLVHHSGKDEAMGARGWSGQHGAMDAQFSVTEDKGLRMFKVTKQKDGDGTHQHPFRLHQVMLGIDADGDPVTSCVAVPLGDSAIPGMPSMGAGQPLPGATGSPSASMATHGGAPRDEQFPPMVKGEWEKRVWRNISTILNIGGELPLLGVIQGVVNSTIPTLDKKGNDRRRDSIHRAINSLIDKKLICTKGAMLSAYDPDSFQATAESEENHHWPEGDEIARVG